MQSLLTEVTCSPFEAFCAQVTDPYLNLFRGLVPPLLGTIDFVSS